MAVPIGVDGIAVSPDHFIDGERVPSPERFADHSPIDGRHLGDVASGTPEHCDAAVAAAQAAFPAWAALGPERRREHLHRFAAQLEAWGDRLARVECEDNGMLLARLRGHQIERCARNITFFADEALKLAGHTIEGRLARHQLQFDPAGVCVLITPWNSPMMLTTWKLGPALAAGNTVVVKPPEWAPLTCSMLADVALAAGMPRGVINVVQGLGPSTGAALVANPRVARISFTGSVPTARAIAKVAGGNLVPASFELGGKSPLVVLDDADLDLAAATAALQYRNAGQVCLAGTRLIVDRRVATDFVSRLRKVVAGLNVGDPRLPSTEIGPIIHPRQFARVQGYVERARERGATIVWGGARHPAGELYYQPTLITDVDESDEVVQDEIFGPVLVLQTCDGDEQAVRLANGTRYGLAGMVFGSPPRATAVARQMRSGMVWVNSFFLRDLEAPFGGVRDSGIGREGGQWSFEFFCDLKDVMLSKKPYAPAFAGR